MTNDCDFVTEGKIIKAQKCHSEKNKCVLKKTHRLHNYLCVLSMW